ncbi:MAG TPA: hypothetical protein VHX62_03930 [Solirubrobacteraceae bacterium]|jgi:hypothetical protein|nr:hypothetical protein [Solirubrobacteraceae bacterium]
MMVPAYDDNATAERVWWRPRRIGWWMAVLFAVGSLCFVVAALGAQWASSSRPAIAVTFFVGSIFFTGAALIQYWQADKSERPFGFRRRGGHLRPSTWQARRVDWLAALVQLAGTVLFNISTFAALKHNLTTHQINARVWAPDVFGSAAFLISSAVAFAEYCGRWIALRPRSLSWWIVAINLLGSIAFGVSAVASLVEPSSGEPISARVTNAGTWIGGVCFLVGALLLMPEAARAQAPTPQRQSSRGMSR